MKDKIMGNKELIVAIAVVLVFLATCSYAWLTIRKISDKTNVLRAGTLSLVLDDTTSGGIKLEKAVPISDEKVKQVQNIHLHYKIKEQRQLVIQFI